MGLLPRRGHGLVGLVLPVFPRGGDGDYRCGLSRNPLFKHCIRERPKDRFFGHCTPAGAVWGLGFSSRTTASDSHGSFVTVGADPVEQLSSPSLCAPRGVPRLDGFGH